jgi:transposase
MSRLTKQVQWRKRVSAFERSGLTRKAWCLRAGVAVASLDYWRARLRDLSKPGQALVPIVVSDAPVLAARFTGAGAVEIDIGGGMRMRADAQVDAQWLASVLRGLC